MIPGVSYKSQLQPWQIELLEGRRKPETDEEVTWFEDHGTDILFDAKSSVSVSRREREFCPPTFVAKVAEALEKKEE